MMVESIILPRIGEKKGNWTITPEGEEALKMGAEKLRDEAWNR